MSPASLRRQIGQLLIAGFDGQAIPPELKSLAREFGLGGVILFARNIAEPEQVAELAFEARAARRAMCRSGSAVDQEGGRVARLKSPFTEWPPMATLGRSGDVRSPERFARALARELKAVGITLDYAPVLDIHTNPKNPVIGDRALVGDGRGGRAARRRDRPRAPGGGRRGLRQAFPGHGDTSTDSHLELPLVEHPPDRLRAVEFVPFKAAIEAGVADHHDRARPRARRSTRNGPRRSRGASSPACCARSWVTRA